MLRRTLQFFSCRGILKFLANQCLLACLRPVHRAFYFVSQQLAQSPDCLARKMNLKLEPDTRHNFGLILMAAENPICSLSGSISMMVSIVTMLTFTRALLLMMMLKHVRWFAGFARLGQKFVALKSDNDHPFSRCINPPLYI